MEKAYTMAEEPYTRIYARIDLDAIVKNMEAMRENLPVKTKMCIRDSLFSIPVCLWDSAGGR